MRTSMLLATLLFASLASCLDPVHEDAVTALGPEAPGIPEGLRHRAGQPCLTCHGGDGPGEPDFAVGGTIYATRKGTEALEGAEVTLTDVTGATRTLVTNDVGNFRIRVEDWKPIFPIKVKIAMGKETAEMETLINGNGGCNHCHRGDGDATHVPRVYLRLK